MKTNANQLIEEKEEQTEILKEKLKQVFCVLIDYYLYNIVKLFEIVRSNLQDHIYETQFI